MKTENKIITSLPLSDEQLDRYFDNIKDYFFFIDLDPTELSARSMLNYIYNANMTCDIKVDEITPENTEKLNALLIEYIKAGKLVYVDLLSELWGSVCLHIIYPELESPVEEVHTFVTQFIEKNKELAEEVTTAIASLYYHLQNMTMDDAEKQTYPAKKLSDNIGINLVNLRRSGNFWSIYMNINDYKGDIFDYEDFSEYKYEGYGISNFFFNNFGPFESILNMNLETAEALTILR